MPQIASPITAAAATWWCTAREALALRSQKKISSAVADAQIAMTTDATTSDEDHAMPGAMSSAAMPR